MPAKRRAATSVARRASRAVVQKKQRRAKVSALRLNPVVAKLVDKRVKGREEIHYRDIVVADAVGVAGGIGAAGTPTVNTNDGSWPELIPTTAVGDNADQRSGNQLVLRSLVLELNIRTVTREPFYVRIIVASSRKFKSQENTRSSSILTDMVNSLIRVNGSAIDFNGTMPRLFSKVDTDNHIVHYDKVIKINNEHLLTNGSDWAYTTHYYSRNFKIPLRVRNKKLRYSVGSDLIPNNFAPCLYVGTVDPNTPLTQSFKTVSVFCMAKMAFTG